MTGTNRQGSMRSRPLESCGSPPFPDASDHELTTLTTTRKAETPWRLTLAWASVLSLDSIEEPLAFQLMPGARGRAFNFPPGSSPGGCAPLVPRG
jgi:hypothetical protein